MGRILFVIGLAAFAAACSRSPSEPSASSQEPSAPAPRPQASASAVAEARLPHPPTASPPPAPLALKWDDPAHWQRRPPASAMRAAEYFVPRVAPDTEDGECSVITFGPDKGGSVDDNVTRWTRQMGPQATTVDRSTRTVHGMKVTRLEVTGTYTPMALPTIPASSPRPNYRLVGEIVEAPSGTWFFKLTAPDATGKSAGKDLDKLVDSLRPS